MDDLEPRLRRNIRIDKSSGAASVKDVVWAVTGRTGSAATQILKSFNSKYPEISENFRTVRLEGQGQETPVAGFATLTSVIFLVEECLREPKRTLEKRFEIAGVLGKLMDADLGPMYRWADDLIYEYRSANRPCPEFLVKLLTKE